MSRQGRETALQFPRDCEHCGRVIPAGQSGCEHCQEHKSEEARRAAAKRQAQLWAAELKAAQEKHARILAQGPASMAAPTTRTPSSSSKLPVSSGVRAPASSGVRPPSSSKLPVSVKARPPSAEHRLKLVRTLTDSIVLASESGDPDAARAAYEALGKVLK